MNIFFSGIGIMCSLIGIYDINQGSYGLDWITLGVGFGIWAEVRGNNKRIEE